MEDEYKIVQVDKPDDSVWEVVGGGIDTHNVKQAGEYRSQHLYFVLQGPDGATAGGSIGVIYWDWLLIELMFVKEELRGRGYGQRLLKMIEDEARQRGAKHVYLDTFSFQAPEFYRKYGYEVFGELPDFPSGHSRYFMRKQL